VNLTLSALTAMASGMSAQLRNVFSGIERELASLREAKTGSSPPAESPSQMAVGSEIVTDLVRLALCPIYESLQHVNLADAVLTAMADLESRATRRGVVLKSHIPTHVDLESRPATATLLARTLINDAILATPRGREVTVRLESVGRGAKITIEDGGPPIPAEAYVGLISTQLDPSTVGRPSTIALFTAQTLAQHLGVQLELGAAATGGHLEVKFVVA
jgi:signal transduction histidine kinase